MNSWIATKVRVFTADQSLELESQINEFLKGRSSDTIKNIQFSTARIEGAGMLYSAILMYVEIDLHTEED